MFPAGHLITHQNDLLIAINEVIKTNGVGVKCRSKTQHCRKGETFYSGTLLRPHLFAALYSDPICLTPFVSGYTGAVYGR